MYIRKDDEVVILAGDDKGKRGKVLRVVLSKNKLVVEYALRHLGRPIGVAQWQTRLVEKLPKALEGSLPSVEEIEAELGTAMRQQERPVRRSRSGEPGSPGKGGRR